MKLSFENDAPVIKKLAITVATVFDNNPRLMKQFINALRLRILIAYKTGLLNGEESIKLEKIAIFVAISLKWPLLMHDIFEDKELIIKLQKNCNNTDKTQMTEIESYWLEKKELKNLLTFYGDQTVTFKALDLDHLLKIAVPIGIIEDNEALSETDKIEIKETQDSIVGLQNEAKIIETELNSLITKREEIYKKLQDGNTINSEREKMQAEETTIINAIVSNIAKARSCQGKINIEMQKNITKIKENEKNKRKKLYDIDARKRKLEFIRNKYLYELEKLGHDLDHIINWWSRDSSTTKSANIIETKSSYIKKSLTEINKEKTETGKRRKETKILKAKKDKISQKRKKNDKPEN